jgi:hypothetical protein
MALARSERGNTGVLFALSAVPLIGILGGAVDVARQSRFETALQGALDTAALAAARSIAEDVQSQGRGNIDYDRAEERAHQVFSATVGALGDAKLTLSYDATRVIASSDWRMPTAFLPVIGIESLTVAGLAEADIKQRTETCIYVTASTGTGIGMRASSDLEADCEVWVESVDARAISATASSDMSAQTICSNGEVYLWATSTVSPDPVPCPVEFIDPLEHLGRPDGADSRCDFEDLVLKGQVQLRPGVYCGTTKIAPASDATLAAGEYVFRGKLEIGSGSRASGQDLLLYFQGREAGLTIGNGSRFEGHGRLDGDFAGVVIYVDRDCQQCANIVEAGGRAAFEGTLYAPSATFIVQSRASAVSESHALMIVHRIFLESSGSLTLRLDEVGIVPIAYTDGSVVRMVK